MRKALNRAIAPFGLEIHKTKKLREQMKQFVPRFEYETDLDFLYSLTPDMGDDPKKVLAKSHAQLRQDVFVLLELNWKRDGYFVEFGATDGVTLSNTYMLEKEYGWTGILAEPSESQRKNIASVRDALIEQKCVWSKSGETIMFNDVGDFSTIDAFSDSDFHADTRADGTRYEAETISLTDMLEKHAAPEDIDYLSIDTEGSEFEILAAHDFSKYSFKIITCEHNYSEKREKIHDLLIGNGYERKYESASKFDDWYVRST